MFGFDAWQLREWEKPFVMEAGYLEHPVWPALFADPTRSRAFNTLDLLDKKTWYGNPFQQLTAKLGMDDTLVCALPIGGGREVLVTIPRPFGDRPFSERDKRVVLALQRAAAQVHIQNIANGVGPLAARAAELAPRHRVVLEQLLRGGAEKDIAAALELSPRTVHKYVETIYATFAVSSRSELMALWIDARAGA
jgi:DNA-binding CsgD family transcriptional regulator